MSDKDLVILAADKDMENALMGLLDRPQSLDIRAIDADIIVHSQHDPACAQRGVEFLSNFSRQYRYGLLIFDHEGSGREQSTPDELQDRLNQEFAGSLWGERAKAIVLSPELEAWVWSDSPHVANVIGWKGGRTSLINWLNEQGWLREDEAKPMRPKEAFRAALREAQTPRSSSLYRRMAAKVSFNRCEDKAFLEFRAILSHWFPLVSR